MSGFHEVRLPLALAFGATGGPERRTEIVTLGSGREERNTPWAHGRRRYDIAGAVRTLDQLSQLIAFFEARRGRLYGFRFRDFADWRSGLPSQAPTPLDQSVATGDGAATAFQLTKSYGDAPNAYLRPIRKPIGASVVIAVDGAPASNFSVDETTGVVTFDAPPAAGAVVTAGFEFDTPVRFDSDRLETSLEAFSAGRAVRAPLIEIIV
jgi:uncharacterized protein (TIGR02217 family)